MNKTICVYIYVYVCSHIYVCVHVELLMTRNGFYMQEYRHVLEALHLGVDHTDLCQMLLPGNLRFDTPPRQAKETAGLQETESLSLRTPKPKL